jgi:hypothetical protein
MSNKTEIFLRMCIEEMGIANKTLLEDIAYNYEKWQGYPHFSRYAGEGIKGAWLGPLEPGGQVQAGRWQPLTPVPIHGFVEDDEGRLFGFRFKEKRPFEEADFRLILTHMKRGLAPEDSAAPGYFQKMYRVHIEPVDYPLDWSTAPFDWDEVALWNLRWITKGIDMESPQKKRLFQHVGDELKAEWTGLQQAVQAGLNPKILALLNKDDSATLGDYRAFSQFIVKTKAAAVKGLLLHPWMIGVINGKSALPERIRFQLAKSLQDGTPLEDILENVLALPTEAQARLAGKKLGELEGGDPVKSAKGNQTAE